MIAQENGCIKFMDNDTFEKKYSKKQATKLDDQRGVPKNFFSRKISGGGKSRDKAAESLINKLIKENKRCYMRQIANIELEYLEK